MRKIRISEDGLRKVGAIAVNKSLPMGMGILHFQPRDYQPDEIPIHPRGGLWLDYFEGRMVKIRLTPVTREPGVYDLTERAPQVDYQSWSIHYPTYDALFDAAGVDWEDVTPVL